MKRIVLLLTILWFLFLTSTFSQKTANPSFNRNQIGFQLNPSINELSFARLNMIQTVSAIRYGYRITKNVTTGMEFDCNFPIFINFGDQFHLYNYFSYSINFFTRYSVLSEKRFQIFAEVSPLFSHYYKEVYTSASQTSFRSDKFGYYVAPGVTLYSKSKRVSFDLYYKFSNLYFTNGKKSVLSYKVNFNF